MSLDYERPLIPPSAETSETSRLSGSHRSDLGQSDKAVNSVSDGLNTLQKRGSSRHCYGQNLPRPPPVEKALTDVENFIQIHGDDSRLFQREQNSEVITLSSDDDNNDEESSEWSPGSLDPLRNSDNIKDLRMADTMRRRQEEWADRGAAKIVKEIVNPDTGLMAKHVIKKGIKDFKFGEILGDGSYSTVLLARSNDSGKKYAVKVLNKEYLIRQKKVKYVNIEKNTLQRLNEGRGVIKLYFTFQDEASLYFLLEYAPNGDFLSLVKKFGSLSEECVEYYSAQILDALDFLHHMGVVHRDIKPENILLDKDMKVKLTDFGTAKLLTKNEETNRYDLSERSKSFVGTAEYVSPELLNDNYVDYKCDIWAFGCIVFQMIAGKPPFKATNEYLTFQKVMKVQYAFTAGFPLVIRDLIKRILVKAPEARLDTSQIKKHHFFNETNFEDNSIWEKPPPEIAPYKVTAKAMQPVSALDKTKPRLVINMPRRPNSSRSPSQTPAAEPSNDVKSQEVSKAATDARTAQILENAKREIQTRRQNNRRTTSAASAAALALLKKPQKSSSSTSLSGKSDSPQNTIMGKASSPKIPQTASSSQQERLHASANGLTVSTGVSNIPPMSKTDILWSYYLKNIDERVMKVGELEMAYLKTPLLEKRLGKAGASLVDPGHNSQRTTLLSQVARAGGGVTGFRGDNGGQNLTESDYYAQWSISDEVVVDSFKKHENEGSEAHAVSTKFKKLFQVKNEDVDKPLEPLPAGEFLKKVVVLTTFGRCLIFVRRNKIQPETNLYFDLEFDISMSQKDVKLRELVADGKNSETQDLPLVIETPFKSFVFKINANDSSWLMTCSKSVRLNHERLSSRSKTEDPEGAAGKAARIASPTLASTSSFAVQASPTFVPASQTTVSPKSPTTSSAVPALTSSGGAKPGRLFDNFVSNKGRQGKKQAKPVPSSGKLTNGLPAGSIFGDDYPDNNDISGSSISMGAYTTGQKPVVSGKSSRMLARSDRPLKR
ncbi:LADA_0B08702g1_1 [Lachancea dasiensis]|uniref:non-specific serine/threonine protein kinase n=1 Tax=Lachancea dasiensis TaxID=1072105 RepID=A0A1G4IV29_9SACH|nr:LADA_0B08702g1_1 [Lachancea dasiensis]